ncbi:ATP-binding protein [Granulosicoccaceae sp. 1_MG-2023]|nr:ATP-binding protein [Granulosicoccaceae sp. 1_MG-2023]
MKRLFLKILLIVLASNAAVLLTTIVINDWLSPESAHLKAEFDQTYRLGRRVVRIWNEGGAEAVDDFRRTYSERRRIEFVLLDRHEKALYGELPPLLREQITEWPTLLAPDENLAGPFAVFAVPVIGSNREPYYFVAAFSPPHPLGAGHPPDRPPRKPDTLDPAAVKYIWLLLAVLLSSVLLAWTFSQPLRNLTRSTRRFADGDLDTRVESDIAGRRDAIGELGREFNHMAEQVSQLLDSHKQLLRDVSHELRSPLARMQVALSLLEQRGGESQSKEHERIGLEIERLNALIGQIITLSRLDSGERKLDKTSLDLAGLLSSLVEDVRFEHLNDGRSVSCDAPDELLIEGDIEKLHSAIENVLRNAMNYTDENTTVTVTLRREGALARLRICDHGPGVPEAALGRIFDAFYRTQEAREISTGGSGVGLAISRRVIEMHGGRIFAQNSPEGGLCVTMEVPITAA